MAKLKQPLILAIFLFLIMGKINAQEGKTIFGLQIKPIISSEVINTGTQSNQVGQIGFTLEPNQGYSFGMSVRHGISKQISVESGINFTRRNYDLIISQDSTGFQGESDFSYVIYEIPIVALVNVQLGQKSFLNAAFGASLNFLPSDWDSFGSYYEHYSAKRSWLIPSLLANLGYEYRTYDKGYYYFGFSYHRPFNDLTDAGVIYKEDGLEQERTVFETSGNYLTIDLRYYFHEPRSNKKIR